MYGGNGYIEDFVTPRLLRDAQVLTVWEGTANILGMELVRLVNKYGAHTLFTEEMKKRLDVVPNSRWKEHMVRALHKVTINLEVFATLDPELQTIEAKKLMRDMALLYDGVVALEWAVKHGGRYEMIMEIFIETNWVERTVGEVKSSVKYFDQII